MHDAALSAPEMTAERVTLCLHATWEIDALVRLLPDLVPNSDAETYAARLALRGIATRIMQLNNAVMAGLDDEAVEAGDLRKVVEAIGTR